MLNLTAVQYWPLCTVYGQAPVVTVRRLLLCSGCYCAGISAMHCPLLRTGSDCDRHDYWHLLNVTAMHYLL